MDLLAEMLAAYAPAETAAPQAPEAAPQAPRLANLLDSVIAETVQSASSAPQADPMLLGATAGLVSSGSSRVAMVDAAPVDYLMGASAPVTTPDVQAVLAAPAPRTVDPSAVLDRINARLASRQAAPQAAPAPRSGYVQTEVNFYKLSGRKGWGIRVPHGESVEVGTQVEVTKKNGEKVWVTVAAILGADKHGTVCALHAAQSKTVPICPGNNNCRRLGHRRGSRCR